MGSAIKTTALFLFLTFLLLLTGALLGQEAGVVVALVISLLMSFLGYWFSDRLVLAMSGARQATEQEFPDLHRVVDEQAGLASIPKPKVYVMETDSPNAFATGRSKRHASIAATRGIMRLLSPEELGGVIAHELAHVGNRDTLIMTMVAAVAGAIAMIANMAQWAMIFGRGGRREGGGNALSLVGLLVVIIVMPMAALLVRLAISRTREYQADRRGARTSGQPLALASALAKLQRGSQLRPLREVSKERLEPVSHLFIVNPLRGEGLATLFSTHPPIQERIRRLEAMVNEALWPRS